MLAFKRPGKQTKCLSVVSRKSVNLKAGIESAKQPEREANTLVVKPHSSETETPSGRALEQQAFGVYNALKATACLHGCE